MLVQLYLYSVICMKVFTYASRLVNTIIFLLCYHAVYPSQDKYIIYKDM